MIYGNKFLDESTLNLDHINLTDDQVVNILSVAIKEGMVEESLEENGLMEDEEVLEEGTNMEYHKIFKSHIKEYKSLLKESKKLYRQQRYEESKAKLKEAKSKLTECSKVINKIPSDASDAVWGNILYVLRTAACILANYLFFVLGIKVGGTIESAIRIFYNNQAAANAVGFAGGAVIGSTVGSNMGKELGKVIFNISDTIKAVKNPKKDNVDAANMYKRNILSSIKVIRNETINFETMINHKIKREKVKENNNK